MTMPETQNMDNEQQAGYLLLGCDQWKLAFDPKAVDGALRSNQDHTVPERGSPH